jgi:hypothetical protein
VAAERIPALARHLVGVASPGLSFAIDEAERNPEYDLKALIDQSRKEASAKLRGEDVRAIMGQTDWMSQEALVAAIELCHEAILAALASLRLRINDQRRSARTRSKLIVDYANDYISSWAHDRGMDLDEVQRLRQRGGVA